MEQFYGKNEDCTKRRTSGINSQSAQEIRKEEKKREKKKTNRKKGQFLTPFLFIILFEFDLKVYL